MLTVALPFDTRLPHLVELLCALTIQFKLASSLSFEELSYLFQIIFLMDA